MKTITIRLDEEVFKKAEARRGGRKKSEFYRSIIREYIQDKPAGVEKKQIDVPDIAKENDERLKEMQNQLTFLQLEFQKLSTQLRKFADNKDRKVGSIERNPPIKTESSSPAAKKINSLEMMRDFAEHKTIKKLATYNVFNFFAKEKKEKNS